MDSIIELNGNIVTSNTIKFSAGEVQLKLPSNSVHQHNKIKAHITSSDGIVLLAQLAYVLQGKRNDLLMPYLPYSRYDRTSGANDALSLKIFCNMINAMGFNRVVTHDCHSDVGVALLNNCIDIPQHILVQNMFEDLKSFNESDMFTFGELPDIRKYDAIVSPDSGASKKAFKLSQDLGIPLIECGKHRDFNTGKIIDFTVPEKQLSANNFKYVLIVDDIADGGGTFAGLTSALLQHVGEVDLCVTHGIFSKGTKQLLKQINTIYMVHNWQSMSAESFMPNYN